MIVKFALTEREYLESQTIYRLRMARRRLVFRNLYKMAVLLALLGTYLHFLGLRWWGNGLYIPALLLFLQRAVLWKRQAALAFRADADAHAPVELRIEEDHLTRIDSSGTEEIRWADITASHETRNLFLLLLDPHRLLVIPKRAFAPGELFPFKQLLQKELIVKSTRDNPDAMLLKFVIAWGLLAVVVMVLGIGFFSNFVNNFPQPPRARKTISFTPSGGEPEAKSPPATLAELHGRGTVYVVPLRPIDSVAVAPLVDDLRKKYQLPITLLAAIEIPSWALQPARKQYVAEDLITVMKLAYPKVAVDPNAILIGITDADMYISGLNWAWSFSLREEERFAVISTAHLTASADDSKKSAAPDVVAFRARKVLLRDIGYLHYRLQPSQDEDSVLSEYVDGPEELDAVGGDYLQSDARVRADLRVESGDPCFIVRHYWSQDPARTELGTVDGCSGFYKEPGLETMQVDLRYGLLMAQRSDFMVADPMPLEVTRVVRNQDKQSRAFGIGGNHNLNIFLVGDQWPFTWLDIVLANGGRSHFKRSNWGYGYWDARYTNNDVGNGQYSNATIRWAWPGWKLQQLDGTVYDFPDSGAVSRAEQGAVVAITKPNGDHLDLARDRAGNLLRAHSSSGKELQFSYDSANRITSIQGKNEGRFLYAYDASGHLSQVTDAAGTVSEYTYDSAGNMNRVTQNGKPICQFTYDSGGRVLSETLSSGHTYKFEYSIDNGIVYDVRVLDSAGPERSLHLSSVEYMLELPKER